MRNIFIIHGSYASPQGNWFPWMKKELSKLGHRVFVPQFPIPPVNEQDSTYDGHKLEEWIETLKEYKKYINKETIFIAHSRGCSFTFQSLPSLGIKINGLFLVAPFVDYDQWKPDIYNKYDSFQAKPYLWKRIRQLTDHIEIFQSTNDEIPVEEGEFIAKKLKAKINIIKNAGHFNVGTDKKFVKFPLLLKNIKKIILSQ